jgi:hypothetical protein
MTVSHQNVRTARPQDSTVQDILVFPTAKVVRGVALVVVEFGGDVIASRDVHIEDLGEGGLRFHDDLTFAFLAGGADGTFRVRGSGGGPPLVCREDISHHLRPKGKGTNAVQREEGVAAGVVEIDVVCDVSALRARASVDRVYDAVGAASPVVNTPLLSGGEVPSESRAQQLSQVELDAGGNLKYFTYPGDAFPGFVAFEEVKF